MKKPKKRALWQNIGMYGLVKLIVMIIVLVWLVYFLPVILINKIAFCVGLILIVAIDKSGIKAWLIQDYLKIIINNKIEINLIKKRNELYKTISYLSILVHSLVPESRIIFSGFLVFFPLLAIMNYLRHPDIIKFIPGKQDNFSPVLAIFYPAAYMIFINNDVYRYNKLFWLETGILFLALIALIFLFSQEYKTKKNVAYAYIFLMFTFAMGSVENINRQYDFHPPSKYVANVIDKYYKTSKNGTTYYAEVTPWKHSQEIERIIITGTKYKLIDKGSKVYIVQYPGALGISWRYISLN